MAARSRQRPPTGARPGTLLIDRELPKPLVRLIVYDERTLEESVVEDMSVLKAALDGPHLVWVDVQGLGDESILRAIGEVFSIHPLALEDVVNAPIRPKTETYEHHELIITRVLRPGPDPDAPILNQVSLFVGRDYVLTFHMRPSTDLESIRTRIEHPVSRIRMGQSDYLAYAILDALVDSFFGPLEVIADTLETLEDEVLDNPTRDTLARMNEIKNTLSHVRRVIVPQRDALNAILRGDTDFFSDHVRVYLRDTHDHCLQLSDSIDSLRELLSGLMNTYLTVLSNKTNDVMKVLTVTASIFIPLTFMAGIYGMNFEHMPELSVRWGYPALLVAMVVMAAAMLILFRRKGWLGGTPPLNTRKRRTPTPPASSPPR